MEVQKPWLHLYPDEIPHYTEFDNLPLQAYLTKAADEFPAKTAIHFLGKELTFREVREQSFETCSLPSGAGTEKR